jgi:glycosyltransferase involved in cell wall biosynthesis
MDMKICMLSDQYSERISGIGLYTTNLITHLLDAGHEVVLLSNEGPNEKVKDFTYIYVPCFRADPTHSKWLSLTLKTASMINRLQEKHRFSIFHSLDARQGALAARVSRVPTVGSINDYYFAESSLNPAYFRRDYKADWLKRYAYYNFTRIFEKLTLGYFDALIANSEYTRKTIIRKYGIEEEKVHTIYKALPYFPSRRKVPAPKVKGDYRILMVGTNLQRKGIFYLLQAAPQILERFPNASFDIVGKCSRRIIDECRATGIEGKFRFHGGLPASDVRKLYEDADLFILPSVVEGFGVAIIEAMSYGLPTIATRAGGPVEIIKSGKDGILVECRNPRAIADDAVRMLSDVKLRETISCNAFSRARDFNVKTQVRSTLKLYEKLL